MAPHARAFARATSVARPLYSLTFVRRLRRDLGGSAKEVYVQFDASTIFVLVLLLGFFGVIAWAEVYSRRHHKPLPSSDATESVPPPEEPVPPREVRKRRR